MTDCFKLLAPGWLRMYRFHPENLSVRVEAITFHPGTEELCQGVKLVPERESHQFIFEFELHLHLQPN